MGIFRDDSTLDDKRSTAAARLLGMCPVGYRQIMRPYVAKALAKASEQELDALLGDVDSIYAMASTGNLAGVRALAQRYGASPEQVEALLPSFLDATQA